VLPAGCSATGLKVISV